jgi:hypothetical protein
VSSSLPKLTQYLAVTAQRLTLGWDFGTAFGGRGSMSAAVATTLQLLGADPEYQLAMPTTRVASRLDGHKFVRRRLIAIPYDFVPNATHSLSATKTLGLAGMSW